MHPKLQPVQKLRQTATYILFVIGFILFVVFGGKAVQSIRDPKFVEGTRQQVPAGIIAISPVLQTGQTLQVASSLESQPSNEPVLTTSPNKSDLTTNNPKLATEANVPSKLIKSVQHVQPAKEVDRSKLNRAAAIL